MKNDESRVEARRLMADATMMIRQARRLLDFASRDEMRARKKREAAAPCPCGHRYDQHGVTYSINYSAGFCLQDGAQDPCPCEWFGQTAESRTRDRERKYR